MALFRCLRSGNTITFTSEDDIAGLRKHEGYEEVNVETTETIETEPQKQEEKVLKLRGRPKKAV